MIKSELIIKLANKFNTLSVKDVELSVHHILERMSESLSKGQRIEIRGFGSFSQVYRAPRKAHNPRTGERVYTIPKYAPHFKPGKNLRDRVNKSRQNTPIKKLKIEEDEE